MPQKGYSKVRTGCLTCKKRKVKCDEGHPYCNRCISTGRKCDGYAPLQPSNAYSWDELLAPCMSLAASASISSLDLRAMVHFRRIMTKTLFPMLGDSRLTRRLSQIAQNEPAVKHAALAIGALYEQRFETPLTTPSWQTRCSSAIQHYNTAIRYMLVLSSSRSPDVPLLVCALFICIEILRNDVQAAVSHFRHGILLLQGQQSESGLAPIFYHWNTLRFIYDLGDPSFPLLQDPAPAMNESFKNHIRAQEKLDWLAARALQLGRLGDGYRLGAVHSTQLPSTLVQEQRQLRVALHTWSLSFSCLRHSPTPFTEIESRILLLEMQWLVWKVYVSSCLDLRETIYDSFTEEFQRILTIATSLNTQHGRKLPAQPIFNIGMGYYTSLWFVVVNCRYLPLRLAALKMLQAPSQSREMVWDVTVFYAMGKHMIEIEHGIKLTIDVTNAICTSTQHPDVPPDRRRIRGTVVKSDATEHLNSEVHTDGTTMQEQNVQFIIRDLESGTTSTLNRSLSVYKA